MKITIRMLFFITVLTITSYGQKTYYISSSQGNDSNDGLTQNTPWKTIAKLNSFSFVPGDTIKFKCGDVFTDATLVADNNGTSDNKITYTNYDIGALPVIGDSLSTTQKSTLLIMANYIIVDGLCVSGSALPPSWHNTQYGIQIYNAENVVVKNCKIVGGKTSWANYDNSRGIAGSGRSFNLTVANNDVSFWTTGMEFNGFKPLDVGYNYVHDIYDNNIGCGIRVIGNSTTGFDYNYEAIVHHNEITLFTGSALNGSNGSKVIWEYNEVHDPVTSEQYTTDLHPIGIKIGSWSQGDSAASRWSIVRYNKFYNFWSSQRSDGEWFCYALYTESAPAGIIYGNLVYNMYGAAFIKEGNPSKTPLSTDKWYVFNNTFISSSSSVQIWSGSVTPCYLYNNIISGGVMVSGISYTYPYPRNSTEQQQIWHGADSWTFSGDPTDIRNQGSTLSDAVYVDANILVNSTSVYTPNSSTYTYVGQTKANLFETDPLFVDEANNNYLLQSSSPAIGFSADISEYLPDLDGVDINVSPDAGASIQVLGSVKLDIKILLEGPYNNGSMSTDINEFLSLTQPYNTAPWNYSGNESVSSIPSEVVDWILLELRNGTTSSTKVAQRAAFIKSDGSVVDLDGISQVRFSGIPAGNYYIVVRHRNHLSVMSANTISVGPNPSLYDFTTGSDKAFGNEPMVNLGENNWGLYAGDGDRNGVINVLDYGEVFNFLFDTGYKYGDLDLNGVINVLDYSETNRNLFKPTQVPN